MSLGMADRLAAVLGGGVLPNFESGLIVAIVLPGCESGSAMQHKK